MPRILCTVHRLGNWIITMFELREYHTSLRMFCFIGVLLYLTPDSSNAKLQLEDVILHAIKDDPWLTGNQLRERALIANSEAATSLPDPVISLRLVNLPTDGFALNQEPMSQIKLGIAQTFSRGNSLEIKQQQLKLQASRHPYQRQDRSAKVRVTVSQLWLDAVKASHTITLIEDNRRLFEQLVEIVEASYSSAQGKTRQQDIVRAQLELARLDDRLASLKSARDKALAQLAQWTGFWTANDLKFAIEQQPKLPVILTPTSDLYVLLGEADRQRLLEILSTHPALLAMEQLSKASNTSVKLAKQQYQPQWGLSASYAYRDDDQLGASRADLFSIGFTLDMPLFGHARLDSEVKALHLNAQAIETDKRLLKQKMLAQMQGIYHQELRFKEREQGYQASILPKMQQQADAALSAYTNDEGDFTEVMLVRIAQLNTKIEFIDIQIEQLKKRVHLTYFIAGDTPTFTEGNKP
jgi:outer membrane protein TolC